jgi:hypothetical protein
MFIPLAPAAKKLGAFRHARGDGVYCASTARHAAFNDQILLDRFPNLENLLGTSHQSPRRSHKFRFSQQRNLLTPL